MQQAECRKQKRENRNQVDFTANFLLLTDFWKGATMRGYRDLKVYQLACKLAMEIFNESKTFPKEKRYSLTDQIRRSSRSVATNIAEGYRKRRYPNMFINKMADADNEISETQVWLDFAYDCNYLSQERHEEFMSGYEDIGKMLGNMIITPKKLKIR
jgi:four helix bundle protein